MDAIVAELYRHFARYPFPARSEVCEQCGPEWTVADIRRTPLREISLLQLEALHVMSLDDNDFRHFFPRMIEALLSEFGPVFAFSLASLRGRTPQWPDAEAALVRRLVDTLWTELLGTFPAQLGYFSDAPTLIDFTYWCDAPVPEYLQHWQRLETRPAAEHLADLVDYVYTIGEPEEPAVKPVITEWLRQRKIGERLRNAGCDGAYELWSVCATA